MVNRERYEEFHKTVHVARVLGLALGLSADRLQIAEETLELAIFQTAYDPEAIRARMQRAAEALRRTRELRLRDARIMDSVASMSREDRTQDASLKAPTALPKTVKGVASPWKK